MALEERPLVDIQVPIGDADGEVAERIGRDVDAASEETIALHRREGSIVPDHIRYRISFATWHPPKGSCEVHGRADGTGCRPRARGAHRRVLIVRTLIATVFNYSLDGLLADEGTDFWEFCFSLPHNREPDDPANLEFIRAAYAHIMGRTAYESISRSMTTTATDHPFADILTAGRKVVFSRTLETAEWANTTLASGDTTEEIDELRQGGDGYILVWGGVASGGR